MNRTMNFFKERSRRKKQRKQIEHAVFHVKYARRMREDLLDEVTVGRLRSYQTDLKTHLKAKQYDEGLKLAEEGMKLAASVHPAPRNAFSLRENVEVFVVVISVALGFRTYFLQPYQIPTGSMQPTLYGITARADYEPTWADKVPFRYGKFLLTGSRYREVSAKADGIMPSRNFWRQRDTFYLITVGGKTHKIHKDMLFQTSPEGAPQSFGRLYPWVPRPGTALKEGTVIAKGLQKQGDHIVVNRFITNFKQPDRGDIVVFHTEGLPPPVRENSAYIKRLTGLPGEAISIREGRLFADGKVVEEPDVFLRQYENPRYSGYANPSFEHYERNQNLPAILALPTQTVELGENEYLMMGDNTHSSLDGRYFGAVSGDNIMGIGFFVPWPFFNRGIYDDRAGVVE
jgi:signal peptidase I